MIIYDHLLMFADEAAAHTALDPLGYGVTNDPELGSYWNSGFVQGGIPVTLPSGPDGERVPINAYFVRVSLTERSSVLENLPGNACRAIGNQETGEVLMVASDVAVDVALNARPEIIPCGSGYNDDDEQQVL